MGETALHEVLNEAIDSAVDVEFHGSTKSFGAPVHAGKKAKAAFKARLKELLRNLPEDVTVRELLEELESRHG